MYVYFITCDGHPRVIKIGKSNDVAKRLAGLQTASPYKLDIVGSIACLSERHSLEIERKFHEIFKGQRTHGEWFLYDKPSQRAVTKLLDSGSQQECVEILANTKRTRRRDKKSRLKAIHRKQGALMEILRENIAKAHREMDQEFKSIVER